MDIEALKRSPIGRLEAISGSDARLGTCSSFAFVPDPLPQQVRLGEATVGTVVDAAMALGRLDMAAGNVPNPLLLVRPSLHKEAVSTSAMEGTFAQLSEVMEGELLGPEAVSSEASEVLNYVRAAELGLARLAVRPLGMNLIGELQKTLVSGTRGDAFDAGRLRERQVFIGSERGTIAEARFVPPPPGDVLTHGVSDWEKWIHALSDTHLLVKVALGHYQFETLHPFSDGNGRLGRLIVALQLIEGGALKYPLLNIAEWLEPRKDEYADNLLRLSTDGDIDHWVSFFCSGMKEQADISVSRIGRLLAVRGTILERVKKGTRGGTSYRVAEELVGFPIVDVPWVVKYHGVTYPAGKEALERLASLGVLRPVKRSGRIRNLYVCDAVLRAL